MEANQDGTGKPKGISRTMFVAGPAIVCTSEALDENYDGLFFRVSDMKGVVQNFNYFRQRYKKKPPRPQPNEDGVMRIPRRPHILDLGWQHPAEESFQNRVGENRDLYVDDQKRLMLIARVNGSTVEGRKIIERLEKTNVVPNGRSDIGISVETKTKVMPNSGAGKKGRVVGKYLTGVSLVERPAHHSTGTYVTHWASTEEDLFKKLFGTPPVGGDDADDAMDIDGISSDAPRSNRPLFVGKTLRKRVEGVLGRKIPDNMLESKPDEIDLDDDEVVVDADTPVVSNAVIGNTPPTEETLSTPTLTDIDPTAENPRSTTTTTTTQDKKSDGVTSTNTNQNVTGAKGNTNAAKPTETPKTTPPVETPKQATGAAKNAPNGTKETSTESDPMDVDTEKKVSKPAPSASPKGRMDDAPLFDENQQSKSKSSPKPASSKSQSSPHTKSMATQGGAQAPNFNNQNQDDNDDMVIDNPSQQHQQQQQQQQQRSNPNKRPLEDDIAPNKSSRSFEKSAPSSKTREDAARSKKSDYQYDDADLAQQIDATGAQLNELRQLLGLSTNEQLREYFEEVKRAKAAEVLAQTKAATSALSLVLDRTNADENIKKTASTIVEDAFNGRPLKDTDAREFIKLISASAMNLGQNMLLQEADYQREMNTGSSASSSSPQGANGASQDPNGAQTYREIDSKAGSTLNLGSILSQNNWGSRYFENTFNGVVKRGPPNQPPMQSGFQTGGYSNQNNPTNQNFFNPTPPGFQHYNPQSQFMNNQQQMLQYQQQQRLAQHQQQQQSQVPVPSGFKMPSFNSANNKVSPGVDAMDLDLTQEQERVKRRIESMSNETLGFVPLGKQNMSEALRSITSVRPGYGVGDFGWDQALEHIQPNGFVHRVAEAIIYPNIDTSINPARREVFDSGESRLYDDHLRYTGYVPRVIGGKGEPLILGYEGDYTEGKAVR